MRESDVPPSMEIMIWGRETSSNVQKVVWLLNELGLPYDRRNVGGSFGKIDARLNPNQLVPVLQEPDGWLLWESHSIARYLCETRAAGSHWWPADARSRADISRWMDWQPTALHPLMRQLGVAVSRADVDETEVAKLEKQTAQKWAMVAERLGNSPYVCGAEPTLADITLGIGIHRRMAMSLPMQVPAALADWYSRLCDRPPYVKAVVETG